MRGWVTACCTVGSWGRSEVGRMMLTTGVGWLGDSRPAMESGAVCRSRKEECLAWWVRATGAGAKPWRGFRRERWVEAALLNLWWGVGWDTRPLRLREVSRIAGRNTADCGCWT